MTTRYRKALYDSAVEDPRELEFWADDVIEVLFEVDENWMQGRCHGKEGIFPVNYTTEYTPPAAPGRSLPPVPAKKRHSTVGIDQVTVEVGSDGGVPDVRSIVSSIGSSADEGTSFEPDPPTERSGRYAIRSADQKEGLTRSFAGQGVVRNTRAGRKATITQGTAIASRNKTKGNRAKPKLSKTRYGFWASNMAWISAWTGIACGIAGMVWGATSATVHIEANVLIGFYTLVMSVMVMLYEWRLGTTRENVICMWPPCQCCQSWCCCVGPCSMPWRALVYFLSGFIACFSVPTLLAGLCYVTVALVNWIAAHEREEYGRYNKRRIKSKVALVSDAQEVPEGCCERVKRWCVQTREQNKRATLVFLGLYWLSNLVIFFVVLADWYQINDDAPDATRLSGWGPWAKAFGNLLDFNCSIILLPVLRTILRWLYNRSTGSQSCMARTLRWFLNSFLPIDRSIEFHKLCGVMVMVGAVGHTAFHLINYAFAPGPAMTKFGVAPWITGFVICMAMLLMYSSVYENVKSGQFEIFWYNHHCFIIFYVFLLLHGNGGWNPNFWKWFLLPGILYVIERIIRYRNARKEVRLISVTRMDGVYALEVAKTGVFAEPYQMGQYMFICCPSIARFEWHPFTISSAPQEDTVTFHIRECGEGSWTNRVSEFMAALGPSRADSYFTVQDSASEEEGRVRGFDGDVLFQLDGPHSAPTQHVTEYSCAVIVGAGIGMTPVAASLKSIVHHRWNYFTGSTYPDHAYFVWVCGHRDIDAFRWMIKSVKEAQDQVVHMRHVSANKMATKTFECHIFVTSSPKDYEPDEVKIDDPTSFWGQPPQSISGSAQSGIQKRSADWTALDLYYAMKHGTAQRTFGDVRVYKGRPNWDDLFTPISQAHPTGDVGVAFCGNPYIAKDLKRTCYNASYGRAAGIFRLHKENF